METKCSCGRETLKAKLIAGAKERGIEIIFKTPKAPDPDRCPDCGLDLTEDREAARKLH
jgi:hypothetical protein